MDTIFFPRVFLRVLAMQTWAQGDTRIILFLLLNACAFAMIFFFTLISYYPAPSVLSCHSAMLHGSLHCTSFTALDLHNTLFSAFDDWLSSIVASVTPPQPCLVFHCCNQVHWWPIAFLIFQCIITRYSLSNLPIPLYSSFVNY